MAGLTVAHRLAMTALIEQAPDAMLGTLSTAIGGLKGERVDELKALLADTSLDRARRRTVLAPLIPMFRPRADRVEGVTFPAHVLNRLWKLAAAREPHLLPRLDKKGPDQTAVADRICLAASAAVRDRPNEVWPPAGDLEARERGLAELAACLDLAHIARRGLPSIEIWLKRPDGDQIAELRLLLKDCAAIRADGAQRVLEILFAHLDDAMLILRIVTQTSGSSGREGFLSASELAGFVERLIVGVDARVARIAAFKPGDDNAGVDPVIEDLIWCSNVLNELDMTLTLNPLSVWGKSVRDGRATISAQLSAFLRAADRSVEKALPLERVQIAGRMTRKAPLLSAPVTGETVQAARHLLKLVGAVRGPASIFGAESDRKKLVESLTGRLADYADQALSMINDGEAEDETNALRLVELAARCLDLIDAKNAAKTVRRRAAVAGAPKGDAKPSSRAA